MITPTKEKVRLSFDGSAHYYDRHADFQNEMARGLAERIAAIGYEGAVALDVGCGTGTLAARLARSGGFRLALACDLSMGMLSIAESRSGMFNAMRVFQADAENLPIKPESVDIATSNLSFHWFHDLPLLFGQIRNTLKPGGRIVANTLGEMTFHELRQSMTAACEGLGLSANESMFHKFTRERELLAGAESAGFTDIAIRKKTYTRVFGDVGLFLRSLKRQGVQSGPGLSFLGLGRRNVMTLFAEDYHSRFAVAGGIRVTYEVIDISCVK